MSLDEGARIEEKVDIMEQIKRMKSRKKKSMKIMEKLPKNLTYSVFYVFSCLILIKIIY